MPGQGGGGRGRGSLKSPSLRGGGARDTGLRGCIPPDTRARKGLHSPLSQLLSPPWPFAPPSVHPHPHLEPFLDPPDQSPWRANFVELVRLVTVSI